MQTYEVNIGDKFGKLEVTNILTDKTTRRQIVCECTCGKEYIAIRNHLIIGKTKSCGCKRGVQDISGQRFGKLLVQEFDHTEKGKSYFKCICDCGNEVIKSSFILKIGDAKSCGCLKPSIPDMTGEKFGRLTVQELVKAEKGQKWYSCLCECGTEKVIDGHSLRRGHTTSCGCLQPEVASQLKVNNRNEQQKYASYRSGAKDRNISFDLSYEEFIDLSSGRCHYCGSEPSNTCKTNGRDDDFIYNGIDRVDNSIGYTIENCVPCCKICNFIKRNNSVNDFTKHVLLLHNYQSSAKNDNTASDVQDYIFPAETDRVVFNTILASYKYRAKKKGRKFSLTVPEFYRLITGNCTYCGTGHTCKQTNIICNETTTFTYNGIDRVDSKKGYTIDNCVTCCKHCNLAKIDHDVDFFIAHMYKIAEHLKMKDNQNTITGDYY